MRTAIALLSISCLWATDPQRLRIGAPGPLLPSSANNPPGFTNSTIDTATKKVAYVFVASDADVMTTFLFRYGARTGTPVQHKISLQGASTSTGAPDGVIVASAAFTPPADTTWDATIRSATITRDGAGGALSSYALTRGNFYSIVIEPCPDATAPCSGAATPDGSNNSSFTTVTTGIAGLARSSFPYPATYNGTSWTKVADYPVWGYRTASITRGNPVQSYALATYVSGEEHAISFNVPIGLWANYKVVGVRFIWQPPASAASIKIVLYSGTTVLQSLTWDTDINAIGATGWVNSTLYFSTANLIPLVGGSLYRIGFSPQSGTVGLAVFNMAAAGDRSAWEGGTMFNYATRSACGSPCDATATAWDADTTTSRPFVELILDDITPGGGACATAVVQ